MGVLSTAGVTAGVMAVSIGFPPSMKALRNTTPAPAAVRAASIATVNAEVPPLGAAVTFFTIGALVPI